MIRHRQHFYRVVLLLMTLQVLQTHMRPGIELAPWNAKLMQVTDPFGNRLRFNKVMDGACRRPRIDLPVTTLEAALPARIVPIDEAHIESFHAALDRVAREHRYLAFLEAPPLAAVRDFVLGTIRSANPQFVAVVDDRVVGWCYVLPKDRPTRRHSGVLGIGLIEPLRGQNIGSALMTATIEAAWRNGLTRIELTVRTDNTRALRLYEKLGFTVEGCLRRDMLIDGEYVDTLLMARLS